MGGGQRGSRRGFLLAAPLLPHAYIGISFFLSYFLTLRRVDPSSKSPDVEVNCKDEDRKGGAGGAGVGLSANLGVRFWSCGCTSVVSWIRGYNSVLQLRGIEALLQPFTGNETVPEGSLRRPLTPPNPKVVALHRNSSFNLMLLSTQPR